MHEISIAGAIIDSVLDAARKNNAIKVKEVAGTIAEGATYNIKVMKALINCKKCAYNGPIEFYEKLHFFLPVIKCPRCDESEVDIVAGRECCVNKINIS
ncbi:MAG TPA: hydrogenase/urease maturation nickel metallochaperone HypA [Candidatus Methanoperedens sp.]|nr:hydrogenase/urease maturation nickel metallochaperone HypA [Candidatus Methanoperedens sp.]